MHWLCYTYSYRVSFPPHFPETLQMTRSCAEAVVSSCYWLIGVSEGREQGKGEALLLIFPERVPILEKPLPHYQCPCEIKYTRICACQEKQIAIAKNVILNAVS